MKKELCDVEMEDVKKLNDYDLSFLFKTVLAECISRVYKSKKAINAKTIVNIILKDSIFNIYYGMEMLAINWKNRNKDTRIKLCIFDTK